jgi:hypothetical protein
MLCLRLYAENHNKLLCCYLYARKEHAMAVNMAKWVTTCGYLFDDVKQIAKLWRVMTGVGPWVLI